MGEIQKPKPVKLFISITYNDVNIYNKVLSTLKSSFGNVEKAYSYNFSSFTDYYKDEMGDSLQKTILGFESLISKEKTYLLKSFSNEIEKQFTDSNSYPTIRKINIDPGYLTEAKIVLFTTKNFAHRIYIANGIYAEITLTYRKYSYT
ncbi:MAG: DUF4416 family protein, partial [Spirochaetota bacterium]|nr:DUF4416 family protein [Spirochaetota bacterium]